MRSRLRGFPARLLLLVALALAIRWIAVFAHYGDLPLELDDNYAYHTQAQLLLEHGGFSEPFVWRDSVEAGGPEVFEPSAGHPPGYVIYLAAFGVLGLDSPLSNRLASGIAGAAAVALIGIAARRVGQWAGLGDEAADRAGLLAAFLAAIYPNLWINDALILSESVSAGLTALVILAAYQFWRTPSLRTSALLGLSVGVATLTRSEGLLLLPLLVLPLAVMLRDRTWPQRAVLAVFTGLVALALMAPWMIRNATTFEEPSPPYLATGSGRVLAFGNCDETYSGRFLGYWNIDCSPSEFAGDESEIDTIHRDKATAYMQDHLGELPKVALARVGRMWHLYRVDQGVEFDRFFERRVESHARFALLQYYLMVPVAVAGVVLLWRRKVTIIPLVAPFVLVTFTAASTFGITRYRVPSEVALCILAGLGVAWVTSRRPTAEAEPPADAEPVPA
jgi:4-amino-4-deoxy-L-arabinose transferase-like glycosyltransferase